MKEVAKHRKGTGSSNASGRWGRYSWLLLFVVFLALGVLLSLIQPLGHAPDEKAHVQYIEFLAEENRLPVWAPVGGGEAGYESQHPPLFYLPGAVVSRIADSLPDNWRMQVLRWYCLLVGVALFFVARGFFTEYFRGNLFLATAGTAAFMLTPLTVEYASHVNVDIMSVLWSCAVLWMAVRVARGAATPRDRIALGVFFGLGLLTKLTALGLLPVIIAAHLVEPQEPSAKKWETRRLRLMLTFAIAGLLSGWWYARNSWLYGTPFIHSEGQIGSGLNLAAYMGDAGHLLKGTLLRTYTSSWVEMIWMPPTALGTSLYAILTGLILLATGLALYSRLRVKKRIPSPADPAPWLCGLLLVFLAVSHQAQVWLVDYEFNAGGRYLLNGLIGAHALVISAFSGVRARKILITSWIALFLLINVIAAHRVVTELNPEYFPDWRILHIP